MSDRRPFRRSPREDQMRTQWISRRSRRAVERDLLRYARRCRRVRRRHRQRHDLHRPADRRAAAASGARLREADRRQGERRHRALLRPLHQAADRLVERHQLDRRRRVRAAMDGRLYRRRLSRGPDRPRRGRQEIAAGRRRAVLPRLLAEVRRQDLHDDPRWRLPHDLLPHRHPQGERAEAAENAGRLSRRRQGRCTART